MDRPGALVLSACDGFASRVGRGNVYRSGVTEETEEACQIWRSVRTATPPFEVWHGVGSSFEASHRLNRALTLFLKGFKFREFAILEDDVHAGSGQPLYRAPLRSPVRECPTFARPNTLQVAGGAFLKPSSSYPPRRVDAPVYNVLTSFD
jgi:hypothetical protein